MLTLLASEGDGLFIRQEFAYVVMLSIAAGVSILVRYIKIPYTVALVLVGLLMSVLQLPLEITISSELILALLVPPLVFEAATHLKWDDLRADLFPILLFALLGTLLSTFLVGGATSWALGLPLVAALAFGALISATDPVAVIAFFRSLGVDKRLSVLVEGESLFNDGIAVVIFSLAMGAGLSMATGTYEGFSLADAIIEIVVVSFGGLMIGAVLGGVVSYVILKNLDDALIETAVTVALAFAAYLTAEDFGLLFNLGDIHFSGILSVLAAALFVGNIGRINTSPTTRVTLDNFWEFLAFVMNSFIFLIIGIRIQIDRLTANIIPILVAVVAVLVSRMIVVYGLSWLHGRIQPRMHIPRNYRHVIFWGGLRGAIGLALALTFTGEVFSPAVAEDLQAMTFGVVLFTLLVQGLSMSSVIEHLGLSKHEPIREEQQRRQVRIYAKRAGRKELNNLHDAGILSTAIWRAMGTVYDSRIEARTTLLQEYLAEYPELEQEMVLQARTDVLRAERTAVADANRRGLITEEVQEELFREIDNRSAALDMIKANRGH